MIDFRYHLVSIISIFLALAVGIVLGAGPLQSQIGDQLTDQVSSLRAEKQALNDKLAASEKLVDAAGDYATAVQPRVVTGRLTGHRAVLVVLPAADSTIVNDVEGALTQSGAALAGTVTVAQDWFDPTQAGDRETAAKEAAAALGLDSSATGDALLTEVLVALTSSKEAAQVSSARTAALEVLTDAGLVDSSVAELAPADLTVVVSGDFSGTEADVDARAASIVSLMTAFGEKSRATVVAGGEPVAAAGQPVTTDAVAAVRADSAAAKLVASVDHARTGPGAALVVLALESALDERVGHYGIAAGAGSTVPRVLP